MSSKDSSGINLSITYSNNTMFEESASVNAVGGCLTANGCSDTESMNVVTNVVNQGMYEVKVSNVNTCKVSKKKSKLLIL